MDPYVLVMMLSAWLGKRFPSLSEYFEYAAPVFFAVITAFGIFTNMLPKPGHKFPVPDVVALEKELEGGGGLIVRMAKFARSNVIAINWFLGTIIYSWFYNFTNKISSVLSVFGSMFRKNKKVA